MKRAAAVALVLVLLSACASVPDRVRFAVDAASSATASVAIALHLRDDGAALPTFTDTVIGDALGELDAAGSELSQAGPIGDTDLRDRALDAVRQAVDAVLAARETVASDGDLAADIAAVESATAELRELS